MSTVLCYADWLARNKCFSLYLRTRDNKLNKNETFHAWSTQDLCDYKSPTNCNFLHLCYHQMHHFPIFLVVVSCLKLCKSTVPISIFWCMLSITRMELLFQFLVSHHQISTGTSRWISRICSNFTLLVVACVFYISWATRVGCFRYSVPTLSANVTELHPPPTSL